MQQDENVQVIEGVVHPSANLAADDYADRRHFVKVHAKIAGSLSEFASGNAKTTWSVDPEHAEMFKSVAGINTETGEVHLQGSPDKGVLRNATIVAVKNTTPKDVGVNITGVLGTTRTGPKAFADVIMAGTPATYVNSSVFIPSNPVTRQMIEQHENPELDAQNEVFRNERNGLTKVDNQSVIMDTIRANRERYEVNGPLPGPMVETQVYLKNEFVDKVIADIEAYKKVNFIDFSTFKITFEPADGTAWDSLEGVSMPIGGNIEHAQAEALESTREVGIQVLLEVMTF